MVSPSVSLNKDKNPKPKPPVGSANQPSRPLPKPNLFHYYNTVNSNFFFQWCKSFHCLKVSLRRKVNQHEASVIHSGSEKKKEDSATQRQYYEYLPLFSPQVLEIFPYNTG